MVVQKIKKSACNAGNPGWIPGSGRSPGEGNGYPLQYSCLENTTDRGAWQATFHGVIKSQTQLSNSHFLGGELSVSMPSTLTEYELHWGSDCICSWLYPLTPAQEQTQSRNFIHVCGTNWKFFLTFGQAMHLFKEVLKINWQQYPHLYFPSCLILLILP